MSLQARLNSLHKMLEETNPPPSRSRSSAGSVPSTRDSGRDVGQSPHDHDHVGGYEMCAYLNVAVCVCGQGANTCIIPYFAARHPCKCAQMRLNIDIVLI